MKSRRRGELIDITAELQGVVERSGVREGVLVAQSLHTTGALTINENADPDVARDVNAKLERLVPHLEAWARDGAHAPAVSTPAR